MNFLETVAVSEDLIRVFEQRQTGELAEFLASFLAQNPDLGTITLTDPQGFEVAASGNEGVGDRGNPGKLEWLPTSKATIEADGGNIFLAVPLQKDGALVGFAVTTLKPGILERIVNDYSGLGRSGRIILAKREGEEIVYLNVPRNQQGQIQRRENIGEIVRSPIVLATQKLSGITESTDPDGNKVMTVYRYLPSTDWGLVVDIAVKEAFAPIETMQKELIQVSILILFLFILVAFIVSRSITEPLHKLHTGAEKIGKGQWDLELNIKTGDEVEQLADEFNRMAKELKGLYLGLEEKVRERTTQLLQEKETSDRLAEDLKKFQLAVENASDQIIITDPQGSILYANKALEDTSEFTIGEVIGKNPGKLWGGQMDKKFFEKLWDGIKREKKTFQGELTNKKKSGKTYIAALSITPILDKDGNVRFFVGIERDITKAKEVDRMKTEFISLASHQLRTPLSAIKWFTEMLLAGDAGKLTKEQKEFLTQVYASNDRMIELVNALLNVSRIEEGRIAIEPVPTDLPELVSQVLTELTPKIKEKELHTLCAKLVHYRNARLPKGPTGRDIGKMDGKQWELFRRLDLHGRRSVFRDVSCRLEHPGQPGFRDVGDRHLPGEESRRSPLGGRVDRHLEHEPGLPRPSSCGDDDEIVVSDVSQGFVESQRSDRELPPSDFIERGELDGLLKIVTLHRKTTPCGERRFAGPDCSDPRLSDKEFSPHTSKRRDHGQNELYARIRVE